MKIANTVLSLMTLMASGGRGSYREGSADECRLNAKKKRAAGKRQRQARTKQRRIARGMR